MTDNTAVQETNEMKQQWAKHIELGVSMTEDDDDTQQYVAQRKWVGLTVEEIKEILYGLHGDDRTPMLTLVNVVEAKLKEKNGGAI